MLNKTPTWKEFEAGMLKMDQMNLIDANKQASILHSQFSNIKTYCSEDTIRKWNEKSSVEDRWNEIFTHFSNEKIEFKEIAQVIEFILCLPGTTAPVERIFSAMNKTWTEDKSMLSVESLKAILMVKYNLKYSCVEFYNFLLSKPDLLKKISGQNKYKPESPTPSTSDDNLQFPE